jgi:2,4-dienoyl-CoA reductase-like NADH-dependent reductase (Old Yellow Enzyme family)
MMDVDTKPLFKPLEVKGYTLRNRVVMPPMVTNRDIRGEDGVQWYGRHAAGGVGLVIVEATAVARFNGDLNAEGLHPLTDAIHEGGALAAIQLFPRTADWATDGDMDPGDLSAKQVADLIRHYEAATQICVEAGFDGVEPHGAHGFLLNRFFSPADNARSDAYGGDLRGRMKLGLDIVGVCRKALGRDRLLLYRHTVVRGTSYGLDESLQFARALVAAGVDILDISPANGANVAQLAAPFRRFGAPVIAVGLMDKVENAVEALRAKRADLIAVGRGLIADPEWPIKVKEGRFGEIVACLHCDQMCFGNLRKDIPIACAQWESHS